MNCSQASLSYLLLFSMEERMKVLGYQKWFHYENNKLINDAKCPNCGSKEFSVYSAQNDRLFCPNCYTDEWKGISNFGCWDSLNNQRYIKFIKKENLR